MAIRTAKTSKLRFIEYIPSRGLLLQVHSAFGTKGYPPSLADFAFWANGTSVISVITIRTICLRYLRTAGQNTRESGCGASLSLFSPRQSAQSIPERNH